MNVGREHGGAIVNTLLLAYIASSLPLILVFYTSQVPLHILIQSEMIFTEILRGVVSSIGLLLAIPLTTFFAVYFKNGEDTSKIKTEGHFGHSH